MAVRRQLGQAHLGERLRELRLERGLSLTAVAEATGLSASSLSVTENGKSDITFGRLVRLIDFYGVTLSELLPEPPPTEPVVSARPSAARSRRLELEKGSELFWLVLQGDVEVTVEGHDAIVLHAGDSLLVEHGGRLVVRNPGAVPATFVAVGLDTAARRAPG